MLKMRLRADPQASNHLSERPSRWSGASITTLGLTPPDAAKIAPNSDHHLVREGSSAQVSTSSSGPKQAGALDCDHAPRSLRRLLQGWPT